MTKKKKNACDTVELIHVDILLPRKVHWVYLNVFEVMVNMSTFGVVCTVGTNVFLSSIAGFGVCKFSRIILVR